MTVWVKAWLVAALFCAWPLSSAVAQAAEQTGQTERILRYDSEIDVQPNGDMLVTETITVRALGRNIRRGIFRDFPLVYRGPSGGQHRVDFKLVSVERGGAPEPHHTEHLGSGVRIYVGSADRMLQHGVHTYRIRYRTGRQLGFFDHHDELYWNVTGNGWAFPIDQVTARVRLPGAAHGEALELTAYTGGYGSKAAAVSSTMTAAGHAAFETTRPLKPEQGLTIVVGFPKGIVAEPGLGQRLAWQARDAAGGLIAMLTLAALLVYYLCAWFKVGRDPEAGVVVPEYAPPDGYSPAMLRFVASMQHDHRAMAAALVHLGVAGKVQLAEDDGGDFTVSVTDASTTGLPADEAELLRRLARRKSLRFTQANHRSISALLRQHDAALEKQLARTYFKRNRGFLAGAVKLTLIGLLATLVTVYLTWGADAAAISGLLVIPVAALGCIGCMCLNQAIGYGGGKIIGALGAVLILVPVLAFQIGAVLIGSTLIHWLAVVGLSLVCMLHVLFYHLLKAHTARGRALLDRIAGLKLYMSVAEKDEKTLSEAPEKTPKLFERLLPYAIALDVENRWAQRFEQVLAQAGSPDTAHHDGVGTWYHGHRSFADAGRMTSAVSGGLASSISASSAAPSSSSGGGGGGFSGGGGGGGGGGGW